MINSFRRNSVSAFILLIILCLVVHFRIFVESPRFPDYTYSGLFSLLLSYHESLSGYVWSCFFLFLIFFQALRLQFMVDNAKMLAKPSMVVALGYILMSGLLPVWKLFGPSVLSNSLIILLMTMITKLDDTTVPRKLLFNIGLLTGIAFCCFFATAPIILVVLFSLMVIRPFRITEWFVLLLGVLTPFYLIFAAFFLFGNMSGLVKYLPSFHPGIPLLGIGPATWISFSLLALFVCCGILWGTSGRYRVLIQVRRLWVVMGALLVLSLGGSFLFNYGMEPSFLFLVPASCFASAMLLFPKKRWFPNLLFFIALLWDILNSSNFPNF